MNYQNQSKQMAIDALIKLVESAPSIHSQVVGLPYQQSQRYDVSVQEFNNWLDYINSILDITFSYTDFDYIYIVKTRILQISFQNEITFVQRIEQIKSEILNLARRMI